MIISKLITLAQFYSFLTNMGQVSAGKIRRKKVFNSQLVRGASFRSDSYKIYISASLSLLLNGVSLLS